MVNIPPGSVPGAQTVFCFACLSSFVILQTTQGSTASIHLLFPSRAQLRKSFFFFFLYRRLSAAWTRLLVLLKLQLRGTSPRPGWLCFTVRFTETVLSRENRPTALGNDVQVAKVVSTQNKPTAHRKEEPFEQHPDTQPLLGWLRCAQPLQMLVGECRGRHPWRRRIVTFTWKEALKLFFFLPSPCQWAVIHLHVFYMCSFKGWGVCVCVNSPRSSGTCWDNCWPPPRC